MNTDILGISELKWTGMGEFNSDEHPGLISCKMDWLDLLAVLGVHWKG